MSINQRRDDVSRFYRPIELTEKACAWLFRANMILAIASMAAAPWTAQHAPGIFEAVLLVLVVVQAVASCVVRLYLAPLAMDKRRKQLLSDAMGVRLNEDRTEGYYNNPLSPSLKRLAVNTLENSLFSNAIASEMLIQRRWRAGCYLVIWLGLVLYRHTTMDALAIATQVVFSAEVFAEWMNLEILSRRHRATFDHFYSHFMNGTGYTTPAGQASILDGVIGYECDKARAGIQLSSKIFQKRNAELSEKWNEIRKDVGIDPAVAPPIE